ncbi:hypothetical protein OQJ18_06890 [Fluoribacter dumoffii]|uniref:hypothetical protein n=1 Tax=Fluoribacter dumoffii TaxID=463 RepID=UPI002244F228|nr:hypothetical protein [Fluoribacter dumoffii]MCW8418182.1 hypothetical protein [Fluoribacter dumoffii]MCW8453976.1 hypothetical protein [Fluoribacter dumoffii]MCW8461953.1 hypothetical protein [Fluoribacter dumoffii]MCW8482165.1 hypothetical protein [Fluoribacter dumoffii]
MGYRDGLKFQFTKMDALHALSQPVSSLLGISDQTEQTLKKLGIKTVYDLATCPIFQIAQDIASAANGEGNSIVARSGRISSSFIDADAPQTPAALVGAEIDVFRDINNTLANELKNNLQVETVGDLGRWPPFCAAQLILSVGVPDLNQQEEEKGSELVPRLGEYPTERHYYRSVVIDQVTPQETTDLTTAGPIDISPTVAADFGFKAPAVGAMLTFAQSWFAQGVTLGNLLHSVALAPGESTRIAVMDWSRQVKASGQEAISESENLTNTTTHNRAISEVQDAVASEVQSGFSKTSGSSTTSAGGGGLGLSIGPLTLGGSGSSANSSSNAESFSTSSGTRNLAATMNQRVADATQQAASSVRDRRASIVKEVSEEEHQSVSTRIIANYNHMHALTIQYYEVIEIYRVNVQLQQVERCLFVPMKLIQFDEETIKRYQGVLANAALSQRAKELLTRDFGSVIIQPALPLRPRRSVFDQVVAIDRAASLNIAMRAATNATNTAEEGGNTPPPAAEPTTQPIPPLANEPYWVNDELVRASRILLTGIAKPGTNNVSLPGDTIFYGVTLDLIAQNRSSISITAVNVDLQSGNIIKLNSISPINWVSNDSIPIQELAAIRITSANTSYLTGRLTLQLSYNSAKFPISLPVEISPNAVEVQLCRFLVDQSDETELKMHLEQNRLHYSKAIWRALDPSQIALLLSAYTFEGKPIGDLIDPNPVMVASNYLVFRMPSFVAAVGIENTESDTEDEAHKKWQGWLKDRGLILGANSAVEQLIPIPTGGVFAEAVLGRSNCAERLDATRFWNWQDSPIPLQPPEIAAIQMESRTQPVDVTPGQLGAPVLNIMNPTALPDPTGVGAILNAVQNGNMFRDMAGLASTAALAEALGSNSTSAGIEAGKQAAANLAVAAQKDIEEKKIAAQLALAAMGLPSANAGATKNISEGGALLNTATDMDKRSPRVPSGSSGSGINGSGVNGSSLNGSGNGSSTGTGDTMPGVPDDLRNLFNGNSRADDVLAKMNWGSLGESGASIIPASYSDKGGGSGSTSTTRAVISFELACYGKFPKPWASEADEVQGLGNNKWLPSEEDFDAISPAATSGNNQATKPYGQVETSLEDLINTVTYFAPKVAGFGTSYPSKVVRLNLFLYAQSGNIGFEGILTTTGKWQANLGNDIKSAGLDSALITKISKNAATKTLLAKLKKAWDPSTEIWLYTCSDVISDAFGKKLAKLLGAKIRAFDDPFWVLPVYDTTQQKILSRDEFGIGSDFAAAASTRTKDLHSLDVLSKRTFKP